MSELEQTLGFCTRCGRIVEAPCKPNTDLTVDGLSATEELPPLLAMTIRAKPEADLLTQQFACVAGRQLARLKLAPQEVRVFTAYRIYEGLAHGVRYETPRSSPLKIDPETIDEVFDGRPTARLEADVPNWEDDPLQAGFALSHHSLAAEHQTKQHRQLRQPEEIINTPTDRAYLFHEDVPFPIELDRRPYWTDRALTGLYHPNPYHPPLDRVSVQTRWGQRTRRVITEPVPQRFAHLPQYRSDQWSRVKV
ncbi:hypothetical protein EBB79_15065 [Parasedimentitalea marina]|uniref:Uncharacterized protein n=1 Tax=Parasedimentitalea marina TaxID=2483033 RepID=A0A3T0N503_9RHOB|nr:hypothetical protein [Parasedimentitalea marina]AZV79061.1 hypothetical protein EBB79_15065 [Parasedimentitalea marina]